MSSIRVLSVLKQDVFGRVELVGVGEERRVRRVACGSRVPLSRLVAMVLLRREQRALERLEGFDGACGLERDPRWLVAPAPDTLAPREMRVLVRSWVAGTPLSRAEELPEDFFELLAQLVRELHARGVRHNDLHKEQNVLVRPDGRPALIDFQLASVHERNGFTARVRAKEDLRHVEKHRRRYMRLGRGPRGREIDVRAVRRLRRSAVAWLWRRLAKPVYEFVTRRLLGTRDGEERRSSRGPWPRWTAPIGSSAVLAPPEPTSIT